MRNFILVALTTIQIMAQEPLPFSFIPTAPDEITTANTLTRMIQGLGFRYYWATEGLTLKDLKYRPTEEAQSTLETLQHIYGLAMVIKNTTENSANPRPMQEIPNGYKALRKATLSLLSIASEKLILATEEEVSQLKVVFDRQGKISSFPVWNLMNGPLQDAIYHTGQIVSFRRTTGNPIPKGVNVFLGVKN